eukprot:10474556-Karenia_brevis.AAC.1
MHYSNSPQEFRSKALSIMQHWQEIGVTAATTWRDKSGKVHTLNSYFDLQWLQKAPEWHFGHGAVCPTTNSCTERLVGLVRQNAGSVPNAMREFVRFLIGEAEHHSKQVWNPSLSPEPSRDVWRRAV